MALPKAQEAALYTPKKRSTRPTLSDVHANTVTILAWIQHLDTKWNQQPLVSSTAIPKTVTLTSAPAKKTRQPRKKKSVSPEDSEPDTPCLPNVATNHHLDMPSLDHLFSELETLPSCKTCGSLLKEKIIYSQTGAELKMVECNHCNYSMLT